MSADWHTFLEWLGRHGMDDPDETWRRYSSLVPEKSIHGEAVEWINRGADILPGPMRVLVAAGVTLLMREYEWSPHAHQLCRELGACIRDVAEELNVKRPGCIATALVFDWDGQGKLVGWYGDLTAIALMLMCGPTREMIQPISFLCNRVFAQLSEFLRQRLRESDRLGEPYMRGARIGYMDSLSRYSDAARRLERELGQVVFSESMPLGTEGLPP